MQFKVFNTIGKFQQYASLCLSGEDLSNGMTRDDLYNRILRLKLPLLREMTDVQHNFNHYASAAAPVSIRCFLYRGFYDLKELLSEERKELIEKQSKEYWKNAYGTGVSASINTAASYWSTSTVNVSTAGTNITTGNFGIGANGTIRIGAGQAGQILVNVAPAQYEYVIQYDQAAGGLQWNDADNIAAPNADENAIEELFRDLDPQQEIAYDEQPNPAATARMNLAWE